MEENRRNLDISNLDESLLKANTFGTRTTELAKHEFEFCFPFTFIAIFILFTIYKVQLFQFFNNIYNIYNL